MARVLILGGTGEAADLADALAEDAGLDVITSLAGRTTEPRRPAGRLRTGGFGGAEAMADELRTMRIGAVVDATHPFASRIGRTAARACESAGVPRLRLLRPMWHRQADDHWHEVDTMGEAAALAARLGRAILVTVGQRDLDRLPRAEGLRWIVRTIEPLAARRDDWTTIEARGPHTLDDEIALMRAHAVDVLLTKASGGAATRAKIDAARRLGIPVVMVRRPAPQPGPLVADVESAVLWVRRHVDG